MCLRTADTFVMRLLCFSSALFEDLDSRKLLTLNKLEEGTAAGGDIGDLGGYAELLN